MVAVRWNRESSRQAGLAALAVAVLALAGCRATDLPLWAAGPAEPEAYGVEKVCDVVYHSGPDASKYRHRLDLFLPKGKKDFPVVVLVHGGAWMMGDNRCCGLHTAVAEWLAGQGIGVVAPNYRLSPCVKHPEHAHDVARAVAWTQDHIEDYGGCPRQMFLVGHSAGGHLVALLATDESYLKDAGGHAADIKGVVAISGVYDIPPGKVEITLGGKGPDAAGIEQVLPIRGAPAVTLPKSALPGLPLSLNVYGPIFGKDPKAREQASPINHVRRGLPPFLMFSAENDLPTLPRMAAEFHQALRDHDCDARLIQVPARNHNSIFFSAISSDDPVARAMLEFIREHAAGRGENTNRSGMRE